MRRLKDYEKIVGKEIIDEIRQRTKKFSNKHVVCINSTYDGGGVAEILISLVSLFNEAGLDFGWRILHGSPDFFMITKKFHNALQGEKIHLSQRKKNIYLIMNKMFSEFTHLKHDLVIVHDQQPLALIDFYEKKQPWIFRCHVDLTNPNPTLFNYMKHFINKYDHFVVSKQEYKQDLDIPQSVIIPTIDPLSKKNRPISEKTMNKFLKKFNIKTNKPIISQISRFDKWKDPLGVLKIFELVRKKINCQLVLLGSLASDDPEGQALFEKVEKKAQNSKYHTDIHIILISSNFLVNCLQRASSVVIQKSSREGFGLVVSESIYKETPVVASDVGGIPFQIIDNKTGFLHKPNDIKGFSSSVIKLLEDEKLRKEMGKAGKEHVIKNFMITRLMLDWLDLFDKYLK